MSGDANYDSSIHNRRRRRDRPDHSPGRV